MSGVSTLIREQAPVLAFAAVMALAVMYVLGFDQGHLLAPFQGSLAFEQNLIHEAVHDARHAAGFPCH